MFIFIPIFAELFKGLGVDLPFPTDIFIATYKWSLPLFYLCASAVAVAKQFATLRGSRLRVADITLICAGVLVPAVAVVSMYLPLFGLIHKLNQMR
jgi:type II secretory pathway component PulF